MVCASEGTPPTALKPMPAYGALNSSFNASAIQNHFIEPEHQGTNSIRHSFYVEPQVEDALTKGGQKGDEFSGVNTASNDDRLTGNEMWSPQPACVPFTSEPGSKDHIVHHLGTTSGPGGTSFSTENLDSRLINHDDVFLPQPGCTITAEATIGVIGSDVPVENFCTGYCFDGNTSQRENIFAPSNMQIMNDSLF